MELRRAIPTKSGRRRRPLLKGLGWALVAVLTCFIVAVAAGLLWSHVPLWVPLALLVAASVLPYVAVLLATTARRRREEPDVYYEACEIGPAPRKDELGGGR